MKKEIYEVLYKYALECKSRVQMEKKVKNRNERLTSKKYELANRRQNLQKNR